MLIDTHSHIYYEPYENQIDEIISRANKKMPAIDKTENTEERPVTKIDLIGRVQFED